MLLPSFCFFRNKKQTHTSREKLLPLPCSSRQFLFKESLEFPPKVNLTFEPKKEGKEIPWLLFDRKTSFVLWKKSQREKKAIRNAPQIGYAFHSHSCLFSFHFVYVYLYYRVYVSCVSLFQDISLLSVLSLSSLSHRESRERSVRHDQSS